MKTLLVYYSHSGNTRKLAEALAAKIHADTFELLPEKPYPSVWDDLVFQVKDEMAQNFFPKLASMPKNLSNYDRVFLGSPNWCGSIARPVASFLRDAEISCPVCTFCCSESSGSGFSLKDARDLRKDLSIQEVLSYRTELDGNCEDFVSAWLKQHPEYK